MLSCGFSSTAGAVSFCGGVAGAADGSLTAGAAACPASAAGVVCDDAAGVVVWGLAEADVLGLAAAFVEELALLPVGSPAFQLSEAGTLKETDLPSVEATIVPASSVR